MNLFSNFTLCPMFVQNTFITAWQSLCFVLHLYVNLVLHYIHSTNKNVACKSSILWNFPSLLSLFFSFFITVCDRDNPRHLWGIKTFPNQEEYRTHQQHLRFATSSPRSWQIESPVHAAKNMRGTVFGLIFNSSIKTKLKIVNCEKKG